MADGQASPDSGLWGQPADILSLSYPAHTLECTAAGLEGQHNQNEEFWDIFDRLDSSNSEVS